MDSTEDLMPAYRDLFNTGNDIIHPLRASTSITFDITAPLSKDYGLLSSVFIPSNASIDPATRSVPGKTLSSGEGGAYFLRRTVDGLSARRLLVKATTASTGLSTASAELKSSSPSGEAEVRGVVHVPVPTMTQAAVSAAVRRPDWAAAAKVSTTGAAYGAYHQLIGAFPALGGLRLSGGGEVMVADLTPNLLASKPAIFPLRSKGPSGDPGLSYSASVVGSTEDGATTGVATLAQVRMGAPKFEALFTHRPTKHTTAVAGLEYSTASGESKASFGYRTRFPRTRSTFTASVTSDWGVRGYFERALLSNVKASIALDCLLFGKPPSRPGQEVAAAVRVSIGPQPQAVLDLTPLLLRDGPRSFGK